MQRASLMVVTENVYNFYTILISEKYYIHWNAKQLVREKTDHEEKKSSHTSDVERQAFW